MTEKRFVTITKESKFYVPEDGSPMATRTKPRTSTQNGGTVDSIDSSDGNMKAGVWNCSALYYICLCLVLLGGVVLLLATSEGPVGLHLLFVMAGVALGYAMFNVQRALD